MKNKPATTPPARDKPRNPGRLRAVALAIGVHAAFFSLIYFGVSWQSTPVPPVEAELWDKLPPAKTAQAPKAQPETAKPPEPKPQPQPEPKPEPPKPKPEPPKPKPPEPKPQAKPEPAKPDPAIALKAEREKKEKENRERAERDKRERVEKEKLEKKKEEEAKKKLAQEEAAKKKREEELARAEAEKAAAAAAAVKKSEFDKYVNDIRAKIRGRANVPDTVTGSPEVDVQIRILPGGEVLDIAVIKRSGNPTYDAAIERAIRSASPLPVPAANSELFPQFRELKLKIRHER